MRLTVHILLIALIISIASFGAVAYINHVSTDQSVNQTFTKQEEFLCSAMTGSITNSLNTLIHTAQLIAHTPTLQEFVMALPSQREATSQKAFSKALPAIPVQLKILLQYYTSSEVALYDTKGNALYTEGMPLKPSLIQSILPRTMAEEEQWFGPYHSGLNDTFFYVYAIPIENKQGNTGALLLFKLDLQKMLQDIHNLYASPQPLSINFINASGKLLASVGSTQFQEDIPFQVRARLFAQHTYAETYRVDEKRYHITLKRIPDTNWAIMLTTMETTIHRREMFFVFYELLAVLISSIILTIYIAYYLKKHRSAWQEALARLQINKKLPPQTLEDTVINDADSLYRFFCTTLNTLQKLAYKKHTPYQTAHNTNDGTAPSVAQHALEILSPTKTLTQINLEEQIQHILESSPVGIFISHNGFVTFTNQMLHTMIALGNDKNLLPAFVNPNDFSLIMQQAHENQGIHQLEVCMYAPNGEERTLFISCIMATIDNRPCIIGWLIDMTDLKTLENELNGANTLAENAIRAKNEFLANMSHEVRTPMNAIMGMNHLLLQTNLTEKQDAYAQKIKQAVKSLLRIVNDVLDFSKIEEGVSSIDSKAFDLYELFANLLSDYHASENIHFIVNIDPDLPHYVQSDPVRLTQLITNILSNAFKFTVSGTITLDVLASKQSPTAMELTVVITDTGIGISQEHTEQLFNSFTQVDESTTRRYGGIGLGLAISQKLAHLLQGKIHVRSALGQGSAFTIILPMVIPHKETIKKMHAHDHTHLTAQNIRVLVYEAQSMALTLERIFTTIGITTHALHTPETFIEHIRQITTDNNYDAIFIDWTLSEKGTFPLIKVLDSLATHLYIPPIVIAISNRSHTEHAANLQRTGITRIITFPITPSHVLNSLIDCIGDKRWLELNAPPLWQHQATRPVRILLAEDNIINQQVTKELLESLGLQVSIAENGQEALNMMLAESFELVFMDIQMPVMNGIDAVKKARTYPQLKEIPIIAMTAHAQASDRELSLESGMNDHIVKPLDPQLLSTSLRYWLAPGTFSIPPEQAKPTLTTLKDIQDIEKESDFCVRSGLNQIAELDCKRSLARLMDNESLYARLLLHFAKENTHVIDAIKKCLPAKPYEAQALAHTLKSVSSNLGIIPVQHPASAIETFLKGKYNEAPDAPLLEEAMQQLAPLLEQLDGNLQAYLAAFSPIQSTLEAIANPKQTENKAAEKNLSALTPEAIKKSNSLIAEAKSMLEANNTAASEVFETLATVLNGHCSEQIKLLQQSMNRYDFGKALEELADLETMVKNMPA